MLRPCGYGTMTDDDIPDDPENEDDGQPLFDDEEPDDAQDPRDDDQPDPRD
jgi:hypothetical protein